MQCWNASGQLDGNLVEGRVASASATGSFANYPQFDMHEFRALRAGEARVLPPVKRDLPATHVAGKH